MLIRLSRLPGLANRSWCNVDATVKHFFSDGVYAKQQFLPANHYVMTHKHNYDHLSILASGACRVSVGDKMDYLYAPACIEIKAGIEHRIEALADSVWYCIHHTDEKDVSKIDEVLIQKGV